MTETPPAQLPGAFSVLQECYELEARIRRRCSLYTVPPTSARAGTRCPIALSRDPHPPGALAADDHGLSGEHLRLGCQVLKLGAQGWLVLQSIGIEARPHPSGTNGHRARRPIENRAIGIPHVVPPPIGRVTTRTPGDVHDAESYRRLVPGRHR
jgi:hypothetical protein